MSVNYIDRSNDEEIIDIVRSVLDNGTGKAETFNEHILIKLMQIRNTPIDNFEFVQDRVDDFYDLWRAERGSPTNKKVENSGIICSLPVG